jgi:lipopolysaccharide transport system ATP-binding protein
MSDIAIQVENVSKQYRLGTLGSGSLRRDMQDWFNRRIHNGKYNRDAPGDISKSEERLDRIWALKDVSFEIRQGEALGIVGRNGAGKSTLLKILSKIVKPTSGIIRGNGKISSLLEVGTGFHQELTGRENIFISGHILGMTRKEILKKFDEIVEFSGVQDFLDTPVKRYSSGMYVRLAFAVAAHLEPDILIVDEVLAVGDAEFQKRCLGKMREATSATGRTIIFVSHNLQAITNLCSKAVWMDGGKVKTLGKSKDVVNAYLGASQKKSWRQSFSMHDRAPGNEMIKVLDFELIPRLKDPLHPIDIRTPLTIKFRFVSYADEMILATGIHLFNLADECIFDVSNEPAVFQKGIISGSCEIPGNFLNDGSYYLSLIFVKDSSSVLFYYEEALHFDVEDHRENMNWYGKWMGAVRPQFEVNLEHERFAHA